VYEQEDVTLLWNQAVHTDREVTANRPDIIIKNKTEKTCTLIDVAIPTDRKVVQKEAEMKLKYKSLCIDIQRMWNTKCMIIPVIIRATTIATKGLKKNLEAMLEKYSTDSLQKTLLFRTSCIKRKVLQSEIGSLSGGDRLLSKRSTGKKRPVTRENNNIIIIIIIIIIINSTFKARSGESLKNKWVSKVTISQYIRSR